LEESSGKPTISLIH